MISTDLYRKISLRNFIPINDLFNLLYIGRHANNWVIIILREFCTFGDTTLKTILINCLSTTDGCFTLIVESYIINKHKQII